MRKWSLAWAAGLVGLLGFQAPAARAALTNYDGFDYTPGTALNGNAGGTGWSGAWIATGTSPSIQLANDSNSLSFSGMPASPGTRVSTGGLTANASSSRLLASTIDLSGEANVAYASALVRKNAANGGGVNNDNVLLEFVDAAANRRWGFGIEGTTDRPWLNHNGSTTASTSVTPGETYLIVTKVISHASGNDEYFLKVFGPGYTTEIPTTEPTTWDATAAQATGAILDRIRIRIDPGNTALTPGEVDDVRIGTDWASVVAVPEPASLGFVGLTGLFALRRRR